MDQGEKMDSRAPGEFIWEVRKPQRANWGEKSLPG